MLIKSLLQILEEKKGEYFADYDEKSGSWCVFHTDKKQGHAYASYASEEDAKEDAKKRNEAKSESVEHLEEKVQPLPDHILSSSLEEILSELEKRMAAARRAMGLANKLKDETEWKKHMSAIRGNMNTIQAAIRHVSKQLDPANLASSAKARFAQFDSKAKTARKSAARELLGLDESKIKTGDWVKAKKEHKSVAGVVDRIDGNIAYVRTHNTNRVVPVNVAHLTTAMSESADKPEFHALDVHHNPDDISVLVRNAKHLDKDDYHGISVVIDKETNKIDLVTADPIAHEEAKKYRDEIEAIGKEAAYESADDTRAYKAWKKEMRAKGAVHFASAAPITGIIHATTADHKMVGHFNVKTDSEYKPK